MDDQTKDKQMPNRRENVTRCLLSIPQWATARSGDKDSAQPT